jgi:hypothetical protein
LTATLTATSASAYGLQHTPATVDLGTEPVSWVVGTPENRKVGGSAPPLPTAPHQRAPVDLAGDAWQRVADFYSGQAWLEMPADDATRLIAILGAHPDAWMNSVYIFPGHERDADLANGAQLHFPREQVPELVEALWSPSPRVST